MDITADQAAPPRTRYSLLHPALEMRRTKDRGYALYTNHSFQKGDLLAIFGGRVMPIAEEANAEADLAMQIHD